MKLYFHLRLTPSTLTAVVEMEEDSDLKSCLEHLSNYIFSKANTKLDVSRLIVYTEKEKPVCADTTVSSLTDGIDLIIQVRDDKRNKIIYEKSDIRKSDDWYGSAFRETDTEPVNKVDVNKEEISHLLTKAEKFLTKNRVDLALPCFKNVLKLNPNNFDALSAVAYIYYNAKRYKESVPFFEKALGKGSPNSTGLIDFSSALTKIGETAKAASVLSRCINDLKRSKQVADEINDANVALGEVLEEMGELTNAFQIYLTISQMTDKQHLGALVGYARLGYKLNCVSLDDVFVVMLNALAHRKNNARFHSYFVDMIEEHSGYDTLRKQLHDMWLDAPTILYIATFLRKGGALKESLELLKHAFTLTKTKVNVALLIFHVQENLCLVQAALKFVADFFNGMLEWQVVRKVDLSPFSKVILLMEKKDDEELSAYIRLQLTPEKAEKKASPSGTLSTVELELLGLYFTVVKVFFVNGYLRPMGLFVKLLDPLFKMNGDLHKTLIRNEQAYYSCISQLYKTIPPEVDGGNSTSQKLYFIGDSHVLPVAWRTIAIPGKEFRVNPVLVTGLKIWHLRKDCRFYTRKCFEYSLKVVPRGSVCIFALGEIDCREGVVRALQKCAYDDIDDCMKNLVDIYIKCLLDVQRRKKSKIFVHPVNPVLKETRENVKKFNEHLKSRIVKTPRLFWLDFFEELLDENGGLKEIYEFDGTHLHPRYVDLLERSLEEHL